jgi:hypothetical protein
MPYFTLNDGSTRQLSYAELENLEKTTSLKAVVYHNINPPTYNIVFENGDSGKFTRKGARIYEHIHQTKILSGLPTVFCKHDLYTGYNPALGCEVSGRQEYKQILKEKGLVEMGNDYGSNIEKENKYKFSESDIKEACQMGADISGREGDALIKGDL